MLEECPALDKADAVRSPISGLRVALWLRSCEAQEGGQKTRVSPYTLGTFLPTEPLKRFTRAID